MSSGIKLCRTGNYSVSGISNILLAVGYFLHDRKQHNPVKLGDTGSPKAQLTQLDSVTATREAARVLLHNPRYTYSSSASSAPEEQELLRDRDVLPARSGPGQNPTGGRGLRGGH